MTQKVPLVMQRSSVVFLEPAPLPMPSPRPAQPDPEAETFATRVTEAAHVVAAQKEALDRRARDLETHEHALVAAVEGARRKHAAEEERVLVGGSHRCLSFPTLLSCVVMRSTTERACTAVSDGGRVISTTTSCTGARSSTSERSTGGQRVCMFVTRTCAAEGHCHS